MAELYARTRVDQGGTADFLPEVREGGLSMLASEFSQGTLNMSRAEDVVV